MYYYVQLYYSSSTLRGGSPTFSRHANFILKASKGRTRSTRGALGSTAVALISVTRRGRLAYGRREYLLNLVVLDLGIVYAFEHVSDYSRIVQL